MVIQVLAVFQHLFRSSGCALDRKNLEKKAGERANTVRHSNGDSPDHAEIKNSHEAVIDLEERVSDLLRYHSEWFNVTDGQAVFCGSVYPATQSRLHSWDLRGDVEKARKSITVDRDLLDVVAPADVEARKKVLVAMSWAERECSIEEERQRRNTELVASRQRVREEREQRIAQECWWRRVKLRCWSKDSVLED